MFLLRDMIVRGSAVLLGTVRQELLTGIVSSDMFETIRARLHDFDDFPPGIDDYELAARYANDCARAGVSTTTADMLICAIAASRDLPILTTDGDFVHYATSLPIKLYPRP